MLRWMRYFSDDGRAYAVRVNATYVDMPERGWTESATPGDVQYPRAWLPRKVVGLSAAGRIIYAECASVEADLWTGAVSEFIYVDNSGVHASCAVIARRRERLLLIAG